MLQATNNDNHMQTSQAQAQPQPQSQSQPQPQAEAEAPKAITKIKNVRTIVRAKRSIHTSPSHTPLATSPTSSFSPYTRSPPSSPLPLVRPTLTRLSSGDSTSTQSTMSDVSTSSHPSSPITSSLQELSAAADLMLISPTTTATVTTTTSFVTKPMALHMHMPLPMTGFSIPSRMSMMLGVHGPSFPSFRTPLISLTGMTMKQPTFTHPVANMFSAGA